MTGTLGIAWRIAVGAGRGERVRLGLMAAGTALGTGFLLAAAVVVAIRTVPQMICTPNGLSCRSSDLPQPYTAALLNQPGLHLGVVIACVLLTIPVLVFLGQCSRIGATVRDRRLAALRLAGATPRQVSRIAVFDTGIAATVGSLLGLGGFVALRAGLEAAGPGRAPRPLPTDVPIPWVAAIVIVAAVPLLATASGAVALRRVILTPLAAVRRETPRRPSALPALLVIAGPLVIILPSLVTHSFSDVAFAASIVVGSLLAAIGLLTAGAWLAAAIGSVVAERARHGALLIAGRRLAERPWAESRAMSAVVLCTLIATAAEGIRADFLRITDPNDPFYARTFDLVDAAIMVGLLVAVCGLVVAGAESITERRRSLAALSAMGVPRSTLRRPVVAQTLLPAIPTIGLAACCGIASVAALSPVDWTAAAVRLLVIIVVAIAACALATIATLPLLRTTVAPSALRYE